jgi:hypothetical protein
MKNENARTILGYFISNVFAFAAIGGIELLAKNYNFGWVLGLSTFLLIPCIMGMICAWFWRNQRHKTAIIIARLFLNIFFCFVLAAYTLNEGAICILIVSPLAVTMMLIGYGIAKTMIHRKSGTLNFSVGGVLFLIFIIDMTGPHHYENEVSDTMIIKASSDAVWKYVVAYPEITEKSHYWFFNIGLPKPVGTSVTGYYQGAGRKCIFERNLVFDEIMTIYEPGKNLTFEVTGQPKDPELMGHIEIERGQFILKDNHDGTTTLTGNSWYTLKVFPALYFDLWAKSITRNVHLRVMEHVKNLCEKK